MKLNRPGCRRFSSVLEHSYKNSFGAYKDFNMDMNMSMNYTASLSASSVVSISSYQGEDRNLACSGFVIECNFLDNQFHAMILTSATIVENHDNNIKIYVNTSDGKEFEGKIVDRNLHYNLCLLEIESSSALPVATVRYVADTSVIDSKETIMALGRYFVKPYGSMAAAGLFSNDPCGFDCQELLRASCRISKCGIGGPVINNLGEVIGISFYASTFTPFLPISIPLRWWENLKQNRVFRPPQLGIMETSNLHTADTCTLEKVGMKFPNIYKGVIVEKVKEGSVADRAGIQPNDVIVGCFGNSMNCSLQLLDLIWDKVGETINLSLRRPNSGSSFDLCMVVDELGRDEFNRWPLPSECWISRRNDW